MAAVTTSAERNLNRMAIVGVLIVTMIFLAPIYWIASTAFKPRNLSTTVPPTVVFTPEISPFVKLFTKRSQMRQQPTPEEYAAAPWWERIVFDGGEKITRDGKGNVQWSGYPNRFMNSLIVAIISTVLAVGMGTFTAYGFSRFPLKDNDTYLFIILTTRMMPAIVVIIPIFLMFRLAGLAGTYAGIILLYTAFNIPFSVWMIKSFFDELNREVEDAARMDGSSEARVFFKICLPQVTAGLAATFVFGLILTWNEFLFALLLTGVETRTVPVAMARTLGGEIGVDYGLLAAIVTLFLIPIIVVTFLLQNQLLRGVTFGTVRR